MTLTAEDLEERHVVFALAQKPHALNTDVRIATLWPLMDFDNAVAVDPTPASFPSNGYVRWYRVANGDWVDGDLVIGLLRKNNDNGYGTDGKEWYQVFGDTGEHAGNRICELISVPRSISELGSFLRQPVSMNRVPRGDLYLYCDDAVVGPFRVAEGPSSSGAASFFTPERKAEGDVDVYDRNEFDNSGIAVVRSVAVLSSSEYMPTHSPSGIYRTSYQIFRKQDLGGASLTKTKQFLLSDELLVTKACKQLSHGKSWKKLRDELKPLVGLLAENTEGVSQAVIDGLPSLLREAKQGVQWTETLVDVLVQDERFERQITDQIQSLVKAEAKRRADEIETTATEMAQPKLEELRRLEGQIDRLKAEKMRLEKETREIEEQRFENELRAEEMMAGVAKRLEAGRSELLGELALLGPVFQGNGVLHVTGNGRTEMPSGETAADEQLGRTEDGWNLLSPASPKSVSLKEQTFVHSRLWPCLAAHGCAIGSRDAEFFHVAMLAGRLIGIPHPGWAIAYAEAMGGTARAITVSASPAWLTFEAAFSGALFDAWQRAIDDRSRLHIIVVEGIDRCPSHAWLRPWVNILAGWATVLPDPNQSHWSEHVRLCVTTEGSDACFNVPHELKEWIFDFDAKESDESLPEIAEGHLPLDDWLLSAMEDQDDFNGFVKSLELPIAKPFGRMRVELARRLRAALVRLNEDDASRCESLVSRRLLRCWSPGDTE